MEVDQQKPRVLLVEDEEALRSALRLNFELEGYEVTAVSTGPDGLEKLRGARFDAVVMNGRPVNFAIFFATFSEYPLGVLIPVPTAVPPKANSDK